MSEHTRAGLPIRPTAGGCTPEWHSGARVGLATRPTGKLAVFLLALLLALVGCGPAPIMGEPLRVGAADSVEQRLLAQMTMIMLRSKGYSVTDKTELGEGWMVRAALEADSIDICWEYTENTYVLYLDHDHPIVDPVWLYDEVMREDAKHRIAWVAMAPAQHTPLIVVRPEYAQQHNLHTLADLARHVAGYKPQISLCVPEDLYTPAHGIRGIEQIYGFRFDEREVHFESLDDTLDVLAVGDCDCALSTDAAEVVNRGLVALDDSAGFFRASNLAVAVRGNRLLDYPELEQPLISLAAALDTETLAALRAEVVNRGQDPAKVARRFLTRQELISVRWLPPTRTPTIRPTPEGGGPTPTVTSTPTATPDVRQ